jgi:hypothetical protein
VEPLLGGRLLSPNVLSIGAATRAARSQRVCLTASGATVANVYIIEPIDLDQFLGLVHAIEGFWFSVVKLPQMDKRKDLP